MEKKFNLIVLRNENNQDFLLWLNSLEKFNNKINYRVVDLTKSNWLQEIRKEPFDYLLAKPAGYTSSFKQLYDERVLILSKELKYHLFPTLDEILIYENKRYFAYWLMAHNIPHPKTYIFYYKNEAIDFIKDVSFPLIAKINIGASGKGVEILRDKKRAKKYINAIFNSGKTSRSGPNLKKGKYLQRAWNKLKDPAALKERLDVYKAIVNDPQKGFAIFQKFIPHQFEWRVVRIGDSFFAHKKLKMGEMASGSLLKGYDNPPLSLFDFVKNITDSFGFYSQAVDIFETEKQEYLINEIHCMFGQSDLYRMLVDSTAGMYI
ncbi:MAG: hypothetical protein K8R79_07015 [Calditrichales bacterium]|nr:hypothetical protein [Calditrichales bacterium]